MNDAYRAAVSVGVGYFYFYPIAKDQIAGKLFCPGTERLGLLRTVYTMKADLYLPVVISKKGKSIAIGNGDHFAPQLAKAGKGNGKKSEE